MIFQKLGICSHINELIWILFCDFSNVYVYNFRVCEDRDGGHFQCFQLWVFRDQTLNRKNIQKPLTVHAYHACTINF